MTTTTTDIAWHAAIQRTPAGTVTTYALGDPGDVAWARENIFADADEIKPVTDPDLLVRLGEGVDGDVDGHEVILISDQRGYARGW